MSNRRPGLLRRFFGFIWGTINFFRRLALNLIFLLIVAIVLIAWFGAERPAVQPNTALVLDLKGPVVEQATGTASELAALRALTDSDREAVLRDVLGVLDAAARDENITHAVVVLDDLGAAGLPTQRELAAALNRFKASGKKVVAWGSSFDQRRYFIAAHADQVYLHPEGQLIIEGYGGYRNYYRDALDRIGVTVNVFKVGEYKSATEPLTENAPSEAAERDEAALLNDLWAQYLSAVEAARKLPAGSITRFIEELPQRLRAAGGSMAQLAKNERFVDDLLTRDQLRDQLIKDGVAADPRRATFRQVSWSSYAASLPQRHSGPGVGVVVAAGEMLPGEQPQGLVGGRSTADLIRRARVDSDVKALVLRVDSPGGSLFAAEQIRRELELVRQAGKPVVVSFGDVAASGGYWVSMGADQVIADPAAITGSIGIFAVLPNAAQTWEKLSLHAHGVRTTWLAGAVDPRKPLDPRLREILQATVTHSYNDFVRRAAQARNLDTTRMNELAQGRVWSGRQAHERKLVDALGQYTDALKAAASRAQLAEDFRVIYVEKEPRNIDRVLNMLLGDFAARAIAVLKDETSSSLPQVWMPQIQRDLRWLKQASETPWSAQAHCLCASD